MKARRPLPTNGHITPREVLVHLGGDEHELHSVASMARSIKGIIELECSCGEEFRFASTPTYMDALKNVPRAGTI